MANQWQKISLRNKNRLTKASQESFIAASQSVSFKSPVKDGFFKNSFFTVVNGISTKTTNSADKSGGERLAEAKASAFKIKTGDSISFVSNSPYAIPLEYGHSEQAPQGMVRITAAEWPSTVAKITKGIK